MNRFYKHRCWLVVGAALFIALPARAQFADTTAAPLIPLVRVFGEADERLRLGQLLGAASAEGYLIRSPSTASPRLRPPPGILSGATLAPKLKTVWNSSLPFSLNDGAMWAGKGSTMELSTGFRLDYRRYSLIIAPQVGYRSNVDYQTIPYASNKQPPRDPFASPWHGPPASMDIPTRFGDDATAYISAGQSSFTARFGSVAVGAATENLWWGPGIRNALVMSGHAPGIPHLFVRSNRPLDTAIGTFEGRWIFGRLNESDYFDFDSANDIRTLSALALTLTPRLTPGLTLGATRAVYAETEDRSTVALAAFDIFRLVGQPNSAPADEDVSEGAGMDQIFSLFGRWLFPESGFEAYAEWARFEEPTSLRDFLIAPNHSQGYTLGLQWARPVTSSGALRLQTEVSYLEPSSTFRQRPVLSTYSSRVVPQGYTHRGQVIGASTGPGSSSQWLALDYIDDHGRIGAFAGRIRRDNAVLATQTPFSATIFNQDITVFGGLEGGVRIGTFEAIARYTNGLRYNYLFQNPSIDTRSPEGVDIRNHTLEMTLRVQPDWPLRP